jgi:hypothetical protein
VRYVSVSCASRRWPSLKWPGPKRSAIRLWSSESRVLPVASSNRAKLRCASGSCLVQADNKKNNPIVTHTRTRRKRQAATYTRARNSRRKGARSGAVSYSKCISQAKSHRGVFARGFPRVHEGLLILPFARVGSSQVFVQEGRLRVVLEAHQKLGDGSIHFARPQKRHGVVVAGHARMGGTIVFYVKALRAMHDIPSISMHVAILSSPHRAFSSSGL